VNVFQEIRDKRQTRDPTISFFRSDTAQETYQWRTLSTTCITRLMSSLARLRVSARTDRDIILLFTRD